MREILYSCPHCNSQAKSEKDDYWRVQCTKCRHCGEMAKTENEAISKWNKEIESFMKQRNKKEKNG